MSQIFQLILRISSFWLLVNVLHITLTKLLGERYNFFLSRNGIFVKFVQIQWHTKRFNSALTYGFVRTASSKVAAWFTCGAYFGIIAMFSSIVILMYTLVISISGSSEDTKVLTPVVPGVNLPANQILPYLLTLLLSGIFHEYGHAVAAARESVSMYGAGLFLFMIYPAAFVDLNTEALKRCDPFQKLRIFCAGVWHNCILMVFTYFVWHAMPFLLFFVGYTKQHAAVVTAVEFGSAMETQLFPDTKIYSINDCPVLDKVTWEQCLWKVYESTTPGNCLDGEALRSLRSQDSCCSEGVVSPRNICFQGSNSNMECLYAREVLKQPRCHEDGSCYTGDCFKPHKKEGFLLQIRHSSSDTQALFIGDPTHLYLTITVSDYQSRYFWRQFPNEFELFMIYVVSLSGALAIFNAVPAFYLDGQHMLDAFLEMVIQGRSHFRERLSWAIQLFSTILIGVNVLFAFISVCMLYQ